MKKSYPILILMALLALTVVTLAQAAEQAQLLDDFEEYNNERQFTRIWSFWEEGAEIKLSLKDEKDNNHGRVMEVEMLSLSEGEQPNIGSIYALMHGNDKEWRGGKGLRFWLENTSGDDLFLSLNFKEQYNEFWATSHNHMVYLHEDEGDIRQSEIQFGNIPIPTDFSGTVTVPFTSFEIPEWNTANGDEELDLGKIESLGFAVMAQDKFPFSFIIDDFEVIKEIFDSNLVIVGPPFIYLPDSGARVENYYASLVSIDDASSTSLKADWEIASPQDEGIQIDQQGQLTVQHDVTAREVTITARYDSPLGTIRQDFPITLVGGTGDAGELGEVKELPPDEMESQAEPSQLDKITDTYNGWLENYRIITVIASVLIVLAIVFVFAYIEIKLR